MRTYIEFEQRHHRIASWGRFVWRLFRNLSIAMVIIAIALLGGMAGYAHFEGLGTVDAFHNAAMILSGMGPVNAVNSDGGKLFAGIYALASGLIVVAATGLVLAPVLHRILHHFHCDE